MNVSTTHRGGAVILRVEAARLTHPVVPEFATAASQLIDSGEKRIVVDLGAVDYVDSMAIGCLMDLYKQATAAGSVLKLASLQRRVETMLTMAGAHHLIGLYADQDSALASFGG